ncbi:MAG: hypothetical protein IT384_27385 [Deltaproteobacteria bacterium]|nr:hypothetical protein [Deltaproteobacteria bacterium]
MTSLGVAASCTSRAGPELAFERACDGSGLSYCDVGEVACQAALHTFVACVLERDSGPRPAVVFGDDLASVARGSKPAPGEIIPSAMVPALALANLTNTGTPSGSPSPSATFVIYFPDRHEIGIAASPVPRDTPFLVRSLSRMYAHALQDQEEPLFARQARIGTDVDRTHGWVAVLAGEGELAADFVELAIAKRSFWQGTAATAGTLGEAGVQLDLRTVARDLVPFGHDAVSTAWSLGQTTAVRELLEMPPATRALLDPYNPGPSDPAPLPDALSEVPAGFALAGESVLGAAAVEVFVARNSPGARSEGLLRRDRLWAFERAEPQALAFVWVLDWEVASQGFDAAVRAQPERPWQLSGAKTQVLVGSSDREVLQAWAQAADTYLRGLSK